MPVQKAWGCTPDRESLVKAAMPVAQARIKLEKMADRLEKEVRRNNELTKMLAGILERTGNFDMTLLSAAEKTVNDPGEHDIKLIKQNQPVLAMNAFPSRNGHGGV